jgi:hypothetical protein
MKTRTIRNQCALRRIPTMLLALWSTAYQASTFKKGCNDDDAAGPRVSLVHGGTRKRGYTRCPSRRNGGTHGRHRIRAGLPTGISPDPQKNHDPDAPSHSTKLAAHQLAPPRSCNHHCHLTVTKVARPTETKMGIRERGTAEQRTRGRTRPPLPMAVTDQTQQ